MDDRLKETLSAMMDDEADELSVRRLLSQQGQDEIRSQFQRWQQMRDLMQHRHQVIQAVDVSQQVRDVLDGHERSRNNRPVRSVPRGQHWKWSAAAAVVAALAVGFGVGTGWEPDSANVFATSDPRGTAFAEPTTRVSGSEAANVEIPDLALQGMDEQQREQLNRYLLQHAQHNSFGAGHASVGYARAVSASGSGY